MLRRHIACREQALEVCARSPAADWSGGRCRRRRSRPGAAICSRLTPQRAEQARRDADRRASAARSQATKPPAPPRAPTTCASSSNFAGRRTFQASHTWSIITRVGEAVVQVARRCRARARTSAPRRGLSGTRSRPSSRPSSCRCARARLPGSRTAVAQRARGDARAFEARCRRTAGGRRATGSYSMLWVSASMPVAAVTARAAGRA